MHDWRREAMATERRAEVTWTGTLLEGRGTIESVGSGAFGPLDVSWPARAEDQRAETSPEELIAAAHASCFSMALSQALAQDGHTAEHLSVAATVTFEPGPGILRSVLDVEGNVPGVDEADFRRAAEQAKENCPVSKALAGNVELVLGGARLKSD
jgi:osmotically inducible protein OsmC